MADHRVTQYAYVGIDASLRGTGLAVYEPGERWHPEYSTSIGSEPARGLLARLDRFDELVMKIRDWLPGAELGGIAIEGYSHGSKGDAVLDLAEFGGILRHNLVCLSGYHVVEVSPSSLKMFATGKGGGKGTDKPGVRMAVYKRWGIDFDSPDECDAYVLARIAACYWGAEEPVTDAQRRAMEQLK